MLFSNGRISAYEYKLPRSNTIDNFIDSYSHVVMLDWDMIFVDEGKDKLESLLQGKPNSSFLTSPTNFRTCTFRGLA